MVKRSFERLSPARGTLRDAFHRGILPLNLHGSEESYSRDDHDRSLDSHAFDRDRLVSRVRLGRSRDVSRSSRSSKLSRSVHVE